MRAREVEWQLAGITTATGDLDRPVVGTRWPVPATVALDGHRLQWRIDDPDEPWRTADPGPNLLARFASLAGAPAERIASYARHWGTLGTCVHGLPAVHNSADTCIPWGEWEDASGDHWQWEPIGVWRHYARQAGALLGIAAALHEGRLGRAEDWLVVHEWYRPEGEDGDFREASLRDVDPTSGRLPEGPPPQAARWWLTGEFSEFWDNSIASDWRMLTARVQKWLRLGDVRPFLEWRDGAVQIALGGRGLFGDLGVQLALAVTKTEGFATCSSCGNLYVPTRRPRAGQSHYCDTCRGPDGRRAAWRDAKRRERARRSNPSSDQA